jgi:hypothetical protein
MILPEREPNNLFQCVQQLQLLAADGLSSPSLEESIHVYKLPYSTVFGGTVFPSSTTRQYVHYE